MDELFDGIREGDPFADEVEHYLNQNGGPVAVDEVALQAAVRSAASRLVAQPRAPRWRWMAIAAMALLIPAVAWLAQPTPTVEIAVEVPASPSSPGPGVRITEATATVDGKTLVLSSGAMSYRRNAEVQPHVDQVAIPALDLLLVPVGTVFSTAVRGQVAAVHVMEGRVRVLHEGNAMSEVSAGSWAIATLNGSEFEVLQVQGRIDPARLSDEHRDDARALLAQLRWMALSDDAREEIAP